MWPDTNGKATPLFMAKRSQYYLAKFKWFDKLRPVSPEDIFVVSDAMEEVMSTAERPLVKPRISLKVIKPSTPPPPALVSTGGEVSDEEAEISESASAAPSEAEAAEPVDTIVH